MGRLLAERGLEPVYGRGNVGLMDVVTDVCRAVGGRVIGVIPEALVEREIAGRAWVRGNLTRREVVDSMPTRKARMAEPADGFIALPGGLGTFEELFEILTWAQPGFHRKAIGLLDVSGYYDPFLVLCDRAVAEGFLRLDDRGRLLAASDPATLLETLTAYRPESVTVRIQKEKDL